MGKSRTKSLAKKEKWKIIDKYKDYDVSNFGRVRSNKVFEKPVILKSTISIHGYPYVSLCKDGVCKKHVIHRLVCKAFLDNSENKKFVNHIDGNKQNNWADNLEWCTRSENELHAYRTGLKGSTKLHKQRSSKANMGSNNHSSKLNETDVKRIKRLIKDKAITQKRIAEIYNVSKSTITAIKKERAWGHING